MEIPSVNLGGTTFGLSIPKRYMNKKAEQNKVFDPSSANPTTWPNTVKQFVDCCQRIACVFNGFVGLALRVDFTVCHVHQIMAFKLQIKFLRETLIYFLN